MNLPAIHKCPVESLGEKRTVRITAQAPGKARSGLNSGASGTERFYRESVDDPCQMAARTIDLETPYGEHIRGAAEVFRLFVALILVTEISALAVLRVVAPGVPVLTLAMVVPLTLVVALLARYWANSAAYRTSRLSPEAIVGYRRRRPASDSPEELSRSIVERAAEIRRTLAESPSEIRVEMCTLGYRACVNDMITLTHLANEELPNANFLRRFKLHRARKKAIDALAGAREALPPGALRATRQEHQ